MRFISHRLGKITTFLLVLMADSADEMHRKELHNMEPRFILIIDDEADVREIAKISLEITKSWKVVTAASGGEGMAIAANQQPDAILLDATMPNQDGLETLADLRDNPATESIPVIFLTAKAKATDRMQYAQAGAKAVFVKPFDPGVLANQIESVLGWS